MGARVTPKRSQPESFDLVPNHVQEKMENAGQVNLKKGETFKVSEEKPGGMKFSR